MPCQLFSLVAPLDGGSIPTGTSLDSIGKQFLGELSFSETDLGGFGLLAFGGFGT
jgi:hypothetical protein